MKSKWLAGAVLMASFVPAFAQIGVYIGQPPPPIRYEERPPMPGPGYAWSDGAWVWAGGQYQWRRGEWRRPPYENAYWEHPHYDHYDKGWQYHEGHWDHHDHGDHHDDFDDREHGRH